MHLADTHYELGNLDECIALYEELVPPSREVLGETHPEAILRANNLAFYLGEAGRLAEAETVWRQVCEAAEERYGSESLKLAHYLGELDGNLRWQRKWEDVRDVLERIHQIDEKHHGPNPKHAQELRLIELIQFRQSGGKMTPELDQEFVRLFNAVYEKNVSTEDVHAERKRVKQQEEAKPKVDMPE